MRVFITGVTGQLGYDVALELIKRGHQVIGSGSRPSAKMNVKMFNNGIITKQSYYDCEKELINREERRNGIDAQEKKNERAEYIQLDITDRNAVEKTIDCIRPNAIIHCAAWTAVDAAEDEENRTKVEAINALGTQYIVDAAKGINAKMIYISTDYVFDGQGEKPWKPDDKNYSPLNYYGLTKLEGEQAVSSNLESYFIVRTAWVFGLNGNNFIKTMINIGKSRDMVRVVNDQFGTPTYTRDLARLLVDMVETEKYGYYHATNSEVEQGKFISWADLAEEAYRAAGMKVKVVRVSTEEYGFSKATRPKNSRLDKSKLESSGFLPLPNWRDAVARYIKEAELEI